MRILKITSLAIVLFGPLILNAQEELGYQGQSTEKGQSVEKVLAELKLNPEIEMRKNRGWTIARSDTLRSIWSFAPENHEAYPSYVKREVVEENGTVFIETTAQCGATKTVCDKLVQDFITLNNQVRENISND